MKYKTISTIMKQPMQVKYRIVSRGEKGGEIAIGTLARGQKNGIRDEEM